MVTIQRTRLAGVTMSPAQMPVPTSLHNLILRAQLLH